MRFIPLLFLILFFLVTPPLMFVMLGLTIYGCYTAIIYVNIRRYFGDVFTVTIVDAGREAARDIYGFLKP